MLIGLPKLKNQLENFNLASNDQTLKDLVHTCTMGETEGDFRLKFNEKNKSLYGVHLFIVVILLYYLFYRMHSTFTHLCVHISFLPFLLSH